jgi:hypothetical protein
MGGASQDNQGPSIMAHSHAFRSARRKYDGHRVTEVGHPEGPSVREVTLIAAVEKVG